MAGILGVYLVYLVIVGNRIRLPVREKRLIAAAGIVFLINIGLGGAHVLTKVNSALLVATHLGMAALVWSLLVAAATIAALALRAPEAAEPTDAPDGI